MANEFIIRKGYKSLSDSQITGSLSVSNAVTASFFTGSFRGDGSELTGIDGFPFTGSAAISGSLIVDGNVIADSFTGSIQGTATSASYVNIVNVDGFTAYSSSVNTAIGSVLDATTPLTATINNTNSPFTITSQSIVIVDSTNGNVTVNLPDLDAVVGTPNQRPILIYKNDYSQNVIFVSPSGSQLINGSDQDVIVSIQIGVVYNPTSGGYVTAGTSAQSLAELELFFLPLTQTGSLSVATASYVEYTNVANKPSLVSGSSQISFNGITDKPTLVSGSSQITYSGLTGVPSGIVSGSEQITYSGLTGTPSSIVSSSAQVLNYGIFATTGSNGFNGNQSITGSLTVTGQVVAQTLNVQQVTSSIVFSSGSNIFGNTVGNTHQFTGSVSVTGSLTVNGTSTVVGSGTTNFLPKFTGASTIGNSIIQDDTTNIDVAGFAYFRRAGKFLILNPNYNAASVYADIAAEAGMDLSLSANGATKQLYLTQAGNLGLGVTPSAWYVSEGYKALQVGNASLFGRNSTNSELYLSSNTFDNSSGNPTYITSDFATRYYQNDGLHAWLTAPSGTAGNAISFTQAMTLDASGRLGIGISTFPNQSGGSLAGTGIFNGIVRISGVSSRYFTSGNGLELAVGSIYSYNRDTSTYNDLTINDTITVKGAGNVGIGNSSFSNTKLTITGADNASSNFGLVVNNSSNSNLFTVRNDGIASFSNNVSANGFKSYSGTSSIASNASSIIHTMSANGLYTVQVIITAGSLIYSAAAIFYAHYSNAQYIKTIDLYDGNNVTLDNSGSGIRITNEGFATFTWNWSILFQPF